MGGAGSGRGPGPGLGGGGSIGGKGSGGTGLERSSVVLVTGAPITQAASYAGRLHSRAYPSPAATKRAFVSGPTARVGKG